MALNLATLNVRGLRDPSKCGHLLGELLNLSVAAVQDTQVAAVQDTPFICTADSWVLENDYVVLSAYSSHSSIGVSLLIGHSLNADVNLVLADDEGWLIVADVAFKSFEFQVAVVYAPNITAERVSFYWRLVLFLDNLKWIVSMSDWNVILDPKIDRVGSGARGSGRYESSLIVLMACHSLVDRFRLDHPGREMWTWLDSSPSRRADIDFVTCPTFHNVVQADHRLVRISLRLADRPSQADYWKFNTSTEDTGLLGPAGIPSSPGISGGGYWE